MRRATAGIAPWLKSSIKMKKAEKTAPNWRINKINFVRNTSTGALESGAVNFSAGWLGQGHTVSSNPQHFILDIIQQYLEHPLSDIAFSQPQDATSLGIERMDGNDTGSRNIFEPNSLVDQH